MAKVVVKVSYTTMTLLTQWQKKYAEIEDGLSLAETLWMEALERLEAAER